MILPMLSPDSRRACAAAASASGKTVSGGCLIVLSAISGQTFSTRPRQIAAFSSTGRARSELAVTRPRRRIKDAEIERALRAALHADDHQRSVGREQLDMITEVLGAHVVQDHVDAIGRGFAYRGRPVAAVGDRMICADGAAVVELVLASCGRDHCRADALGVLDGERADAAGAAMHQKPVTVGKPSQLEVGVDRGGDLDDAGRGDQVHP